ncbi:potassium channel family protein [Halocynthiibacter sp. C4]|uniref:potassium channel family protein n=1 Tax=Halocynthiibacter sp. C4 TaxID=2992758 RepID=UPI00237A7E94|nr:potassium channel family protein [Halocynthiibacter sp. C4]MDE0589700.1 potassium channel family protein [Halocynthiibacter sp. C4]
MLPFALTVWRFLKAIYRSWESENFRAGLVVAILILISGTTFYRMVEGWSWTDSLYFSVTTMSTVGFGDLAPSTTYGKMFTVFYIFVGVGVFVALFSQFAKALIIQKPSREGKRIAAKSASKKDKPSE